MKDSYRVYIRTDENGRITAVNSDAFLPSLDGWQKIDEGSGDKFHHAQGNYFPVPIIDANGAYRYKMDGGTVVERTAEERAADYVKPEATVSAETLLAALVGGVQDAP